MSQHHATSQISATSQKLRSADRDYALNLVHRICCLAADLNFWLGVEAAEIISLPPLSGTTPLVSSTGWCRP
jgi:hypothetical protein